MKRKKGTDKPQPVLISETSQKVWKQQQQQQQTEHRRRKLMKLQSSAPAKE